MVVLQLLFNQDVILFDENGSFGCIRDVDPECSFMSRWYCLVLIQNDVGHVVREAKLDILSVFVVVDGVNFAVSISGHIGK